MAASRGVLLGCDHRESPGTRDGLVRAVEGATRFRGRRPRNATRPPGAQWAIDPSTCRGTVWGAAPCGGSLIPHAGAICALLIPMIEAAFGTAPTALACRVDGGATRRSATRRRAIGVAAITRRADREEAVAPPTGFLGEAACPRLDTAQKRRTRETTGSVRRSIKAVTEGLGGSAPGPHVISRQRAAYVKARARPTRGRLWTPSAASTAG